MTYRIEIEAPEVPYPGGTPQPEFMRAAARNLRDRYAVGGSNVIETVASLLDRVADAMCATKPPRIPEPGLWGVVKATVAGDGPLKRGPWGFVHVTETFWHCTADGSVFRWDDLIDPVLVREGLS